MTVIKCDMPRRHIFSWHYIAGRPKLHGISIILMVFWSKTDQSVRYLQCHILLFVIIKVDTQNTNKRWHHQGKTRFSQDILSHIIWVGFYLKSESRNKYKQSRLSWSVTVWFLMIFRSISGPKKYQTIKCDIF